MSNLTIRQAVQGMLKLQDGGDHATMVGIGPMSPNLIQAVFELAKDEDFPPMFIASRNQVDMDEMGAGYVNGWDQKRFAADIKKVADEVGYTGRTTCAAITAVRGSATRSVTPTCPRTRPWSSPASPSSPTWRQALTC